MSIDSTRFSGKIEITDAPIAAEAIVAAIKAGGDGAVCVFDGIVRDNTLGRRTLYLDYEAYREMAEQQIAKILSEAIARYGLEMAAAEHRVGKVGLGQPGVVVAVAAAHRTEAFAGGARMVDVGGKAVTARRARDRKSVV